MPSISLSQCGVLEGSDDDVTYADFCGPDRPCPFSLRIMAFESELEQSRYWPDLNVQLDGFSNPNAVVRSATSCLFKRFGHNDLAKLRLLL